MMSTIYEPKGRAREYAARALNLYKGCPHNCAYCFNRTMPWSDSAKQSIPTPREGLAVALDAYCMKAQKAGLIAAMPKILQIGRAHV